MSIGLMGKKIGMTREFFNIGVAIPVTVLKIEKGRIIDIIKKDNRGYDAIKVGFYPIKNSKLTNQMKGFFTKKSTQPKKFLKEFRVSNISDYKEGNEIGLEILNGKKYVDITGKTIGKGFAGVMKRHNFSGLRASHGVSVSHRAHGSTGQNQDPGKVFKGKKMAGHMGNKSRTIQNLEIIKQDVEKDLIFIKGSIPGSRNSYVLIKESVKNITKLTELEKIELTEKDRASQKKETKGKNKKPDQPKKKEQPQKTEPTKEAKK